LAVTVATFAQSVNPSHAIGRVDKDHEDSAEYVARTPYILRWNVDPKYKLYGKSDPTVKVESYLAGLHVYDVATGRSVCSTGDGRFNGEMKVPVSGRHMVKVFCTAPIQLSFEEDKSALETAAKRGELKDGVTVDAARSVSLRTKNEKIAALKADVISELEKKRNSIGDDALAALRIDAEQAAQLASSEKDFAARFSTLSAATVAGIAAAKALKEPQPTSGGDSLPPRMQKPRRGF
jgi:hypothetical protein